MSPTKARAAIADYLTGHLVGPTGGDHETVADPPNRMYAVGVLYPKHLAVDFQLAEEEPDIAADVRQHDAEIDDAVRMASEWLPSSIGLTFYLPTGRQLTCHVWGAAYERGQRDGRRAWTRHPLADAAKPQSVTITAPAAGRPAEPVVVLEGSATLESRWRRMTHGYLVTVNLVNARPRGEEPAPEDCLYQVGIRCSADTPIGNYPSVEFLSSDPEEEELRLRYRSASVYAVGHGCSVTWPTPDEGRVDWVATDLVPAYEVPALTATADDDYTALDLALLADIEERTTEVLIAMRELVDGYERWSRSLRAPTPPIPTALGPAADRIGSAIDDAIERMRDGIAVLGRDAIARQAFALASKCMLIQMHHGRNNPPLESPADYLELDYRWYPFQLAYQLQVIPSIVDQDHPTRRLVDLLWFPTGGGKTEAYLAVAAFTAFHRRLTGRGGGTSVITRYTLRLLTAQQFQRSAAMICAAEIIRRNTPELGEEPFTVGLWVGNEATPETNDEAAERAADVLDDPEPSNPFPLQRCPWCGTDIVPKARQEDPSMYGFDFGPGRFRFRCPNADCPFAPELPVSIVDEHLYRHPPTFLLGTVDKFARLAWLSEPSVFFGGAHQPPPDLIIQDELHLLSGPLGTTVGLYEHAIEAIIRIRGGNPKVIASTATIRRANEQTQALFGRPVRVFPPSGTDQEDSFFARIDRARPGRLYLGVMSQSHTVATTTVQVASALLQACSEVPMSDTMRSSYWTLVAYHNSLRELGRTITLSRDDVPARIKAIATDEARMRRIDDPDVVELTGNRVGTELPEILRRLEHGPDQGDAISVLATTSMLSVGVDVPRLALMMINGQPKTTSEYIQASNRVGRAAVPGLVVTIYSATKPRDRSHYEGFVGYHSALYRHVEPTSVTPFALPSRLRALHAVFVILMRHGAGLTSNDSAHQFDPGASTTRRARQELLDAVASVDDHERSATEAHLDRIIDEWAMRRDEATQHGKTLYYSGGGRETHHLLRNYASNTEGWDTLHSMRNVDRTALIHVLGEERTGRTSTAQ